MRMDRSLILGDPAGTAILPPEPAWTGGSRSLLVPPDDPWATDFEKSGGKETPRYDATMDWLERLADAAPEIELVTLGMSPEGRAIRMAVVSSSGAFTPEAMAKDGKPVLLVQAGIHSGEIDGKDAGLMLLRDLTVRKLKAKLLDGANLLFVPIVNVDGHERFGPYNRINQRGPREMGWRTNARNLNLNRDYAKLDTPEMRAMIATINTWKPDLYLDLHVTDGADYAYDITWGYDGPHAYSPNVAAWLDAYLTPAAERDLEAMGHVPGPLVFSVDGGDFSRGITLETSSPRYSDGYGSARHLPTILVENHSLKSYERRVLGTYVLLESTLRSLASYGAQLRRASEEDAKTRGAQVALAWKVPEGTPQSIQFQGVRYTRVASAISGGVKTVWGGEPEDMVIPYPQKTEIAASATPPKAYWISAIYPEVIERLEAHGVRLERQDKASSREVGMYRVSKWVFDAAPFEGRTRVKGEVTLEPHTVNYPAGSVRVPVNQPLGTLIMLLMEPLSPDSFFQWGFFNASLQRTEYVESYVVEAMAEQWLKDDPQLAREFTEALSDPRFAADPAARLDWFYRRTPFSDDRWGLIPVGREE